MLIVLDAHMVEMYACDYLDLIGSVVAWLGTQ